MSEPVRSVLALAGRVRMTSGALEMFHLLEGLHAAGCSVALACDEVASQLVDRDVSFPILSWRDASAWLTATNGESPFQKRSKLPRPDILHIHGMRLGRGG